MQIDYYKFAGWALYAAAILLLASLGRLDLAVILFPVSLLLGYVMSLGNAGKDQADEPRRKKVA